jgi:exosortase D (VPLPA-CTERM-specific)
MPNAKSHKSPTKNDITVVSMTIIVFIAAFWSALSKMSWRWGSDDNSYCYLIIPVFLYLCWEKREQFNFGVFTWSGWGLLGAACAIFFIFLGELGSVETFTYFGVWGCLASIIVTIYGSRCKDLLFPIVILLFIVPLPAFINELITFQFKSLATTISAEMLRLVGLSVLQEGNILDLGIGKLEVVDACSGLRYLMSLVLMTLFMGYYFVDQWWKRALLLSMVLPLSIVMNSARIFTTGILTISGHANLTHGAFHDIVGIIVFLIAGVIAYFMAKLLNKIKPLAENDHRHQAAIVPAPVDKKFASLPILSLCLIFLVSGIVFQRIPKTSTSPQREKFSSFPLTIGPWQGEKHSLTDEILKALWADDYLNATYVNQETNNIIHLLIPFYEYQGTAHTAHAPQSCLLGGGFTIEKALEQKIDLPDGISITIMTMQMLKNESKLLASYFFLQRGRAITNPWLNKYYLMLDAITKKRTDGALVRVEMTVPANQSFADAYAIQNGFIAKIWPLLKKYVPE